MKQMYYYENKYYSKGYKKIAGLDEAGRGCWAGPLVAAACIFPVGYKNDEIKDSKTLSIKKREKLFDLIIKDCLSYSIVFVESKKVDELNPKQASIYAMGLAIEKLSIKPDILLIDAEKIPSKTKTQSIIKGDAKSVSIAAASILAKVSRDRYMVKIDSKYPLYNFKKHKGYGTMEHLAALNKHGPIKNFHRYSYRPIKKVLENINNGGK